MLTLETGDREFRLTRLTGAITTGYRCCAIWRATRHLSRVEHLWNGVWHPDDHHALVQERRMERRDRGLLTTVLGRSRDKDATYLAYEFAFLP